MYIVERGFLALGLVFLFTLPIHSIVLVWSMSDIRLFATHVILAGTFYAIGVMIASR